MDQVKKGCSTPDLYGAVIIYFPVDTPVESVKEVLPECLGINAYNDFVEIVYREVKSLYSWDVADLLTTLFAKCDLENVRAAVEIFDGSVLIDISFRHKDRYPSLLFSGENMKVIHKLGADLSIDPY